MKTILFAMLLGAAACGGGGKKPAAKPEPTETTPPPETTMKEQPAETKQEAPPPEPAKPDPKVAAMEAETAAYEKAKPVFEGACKSCHFKGEKNANAKKLGALDITEYPFKGKKSKPADIRKVLGIGGGKATMPKGKPGSVKGDDLAAIAAWADAYDAAEQAGAHAAAEPATK